ncbi:MAG: 23S rRNA (guanosine(2251)-2'-O)-methyltransferase RlmB [Tistlia sp.]|uniref:23S rRNA (guanosine(2251)-2'-O)-methyltransferase RlmB n=1 Tax=Tistlia sp. TaxID=3057121 RepID=UPI0034A261D3
MTKRKHDTGKSRRGRPAPRHPEARGPEPRAAESRAPDSGRPVRGGPGGAPAGPAVRGLWLHGVHSVAAALANPRRACHRLLLTAEASKREEALLRPALAARAGLQPEIVERSALEALLGEEAVHQGLALQVAPLAQPDLLTLLRRHAEGPALLLALDQVTDPRNVGAILRSAAAFGAIGLIAPDRHAAAETGALAKAASGGLEVVPYVQAGNLAAAIETAKQHGFWAIGLAGEAHEDLAGAALPDRLLLCLGAEGPGLRRLTRERCDLLVRLPVTGPLRDLNVSNAAAVALYELCARRGLARPPQAD